MSITGSFYVSPQSGRGERGKEEFQGEEAFIICTFSLTLKAYNLSLE